MIMSINKSILAELKHEAATTRKVLQRVPEDMFSWQPHEKSMTLQRLATHLADIHQWPILMVTQSGYDFLKGGFKQGVYTTTEALVKDFDETLVSTSQVLENTTDDALEQVWTLSRGEHVIFSIPRKQALRSMFMNHIIHHRGQLSVYLRLLNIPVPSIYGPTADEQVF
jgi:uncharacterized damage-inducible protein DinB